MFETLIKSKAGHCEYSFEDEYVHIYNLFIYPKYRRMGEAKKIIQDAIDSIKKKGYRDKIQIVAIPTEENGISKDKLINFYEKMGLEVYQYYA